MWHFVARDLVGRRGFSILAVLATSGCLATSISVFAQASDQATTSSTGNQSPFHLRVTSNLVVVRVVVRDAQNKPLENLKKEDFKLFDRGKEQSITQFAVEFAIYATDGSSRHIRAALHHTGARLSPATTLPGPVFRRSQYVRCRRTSGA